jgi:hypothetical protein
MLRLRLEAAERCELVLARDDALHRIGAERADQLVLEVALAREEARGLGALARRGRADARASQRAQRERLLARVVQAGEHDRRVMRPTRSVRGS